MKKLFSIVCLTTLLLSTISFVSFAKGKIDGDEGFTVLESSTKVDAFYSLQLSGDVRYTLQRGDTNRIDIVSQDTQQGILLYEYDDYFLHIKNKPLENTKDIEVLITYAQDIHEIDVSGAVRLMEKTLTINKIDVSISGEVIMIIDALTACNVNFESSGNSLLEINNIAVDTFNVDMSGYGALNVAANQINTLVLDTSGTSNIAMPNTMIYNASIDTSGSSTATLWVADSLKINSSGATKISYFGDPVLEMEKSGNLTLEALSKERDPIQSEALNIPMPTCQ